MRYYFNPLRTPNRQKSCNFCNVIYKFFVTEKQGRRNQKKILTDLEAKPVPLNDLQLLLVPSDFSQIRVKTCSIKWSLIIACPTRFSNLPMALQDHHYPIIHWYSCHSVQKDWHKNWPEIIFNDLLFRISFSYYDT